MKQGRNEPCLCGSGKKYKRCCLGKEQKAIHEYNANLQEEYEEYDDGFDLFEGLLKITVDIHRRRLSRKLHNKRVQKNKENARGNHWRNGKIS